MRVLFSAQGESLNLFNTVRESLGKITSVERVGFGISDSWTYLDFLKRHPDFEQQNHCILKDWEITAERNHQPDYELLKRFEDEIGGEPGLFGAIVADRRLYMGKDCSYTQDYARRFTDVEMLSILQTALIKTEALFDELKPDLVIGFICVTLFDYLFYLFASARGIKYLNLRPTRIGDRFAAATTICDPAPEFIKSYQKCLDEGSEFTKVAKAYLADVRAEESQYEGVIKASDVPANKVNRGKNNVVASGIRVLKKYWVYRHSIAVKDNHVVDPLRALLFAVVINPYRAKIMALTYQDKYIKLEDLKNYRYMFFPLHTEPEVQLLIYGRPLINQIEVLRQLAISLPADMILVIKEHPWMVGKRTRTAYKKLLDIPRLHIVNPATSARDLMVDAEIVSVITGTSALEATMIGKPVLSFGDGPFNALPDSMVKRCQDVRHLPKIIKELLVQNNKEDKDKYLLAYIEAAYENSQSINFYSQLLKRKGVYSNRESSYDAEIDKLAEFILNRSCLKTLSPYDYKGSAIW